MNKWPVLFLSVLVLAGCGRPGLSGDVYSRDEVKVVQKVHHGEVLEVRQVEIEGDYSYIGTFGGYAVGREVGRTVGSGSGRSVAGVVIGVAGAVIGQAVEKQLTKEDALELMIEMDNGEIIAIVQAADQLFESGERVRVYLWRNGNARVLKI